MSPDHVKTVVIIDDDLGVRKAARALVRSLGYVAVTFESAEAFLETAASSTASCLVIDIQLGDISGIELARQLAKSGLRFSIIFMASRDDELLRHQAEQLGCVAYLRKPFSADRLIEAIVKATG